MKRELDKRVKWSKSDIELELLDWKSNPSDFNKLCQFVYSKLEKRMKQRGKSLDEVVSKEELQAEIRRNAGRFQEKFISLPNFVYLKVNIFVAGRLKQLG